MTAENQNGIAWTIDVQISRHQYIMTMKMNIAAILKRTSLITHT